MIPATLSTTSTVIFIKLLPLFVIVVAFCAPSVPETFIPPVLDASLTIWVVPCVVPLFKVPARFIAPVVLFCTRTSPFALTVPVKLISPSLSFCTTKPPVVIVLLMLISAIPVSLINVVPAAFIALLNIIPLLPEFITSTPPALIMLPFILTPPALPVRVKETTPLTPLLSRTALSAIYKSFKFALSCPKNSVKSI